MSKHIPSTPTLYGEDARILLESLERHCTPEEFARRVEAAKKRLTPDASGRVIYKLKRPNL